ncbi:MAG: formate C-acetyltransferase/glycerol dehydratase family glycyl radical enzyme [Oscillospiraceae bacterium]|jgi:formate C-acetyltransferase|nr:formate C-acetyltransferase/glycerol dehydratase family glycyl radical enzyme [Oscillospiraceae bacterium]
MVDLLSFIPENDDCDFKRIAQMQASMNVRIATICPQRAEIVTDCYMRTEGEPIVIRRAKAFAAVLENMSIYIEPNSLILGNQASANFAAPVFPEYSYDWIIDELNEFEFRSGDFFNITEDTKNRLRKHKDYWVGKTHKDEVLRNLPPINALAEKQGVLHRGGISMSGDGHIIPNHEFVLEVGFGGIADIARDKLACSENTVEQRDFFKATIIAMDGALRYCKRFSKHAAECAQYEKEPKRKAEFLYLHKMFDSYMEGGARSFHEAVQTVYLVHLLMMIESNGHSFSFGRFDQYIFPYYKCDLEQDIITKEKALEIITHFFIMTNSLNKVRPWGHTQYSGGYPLYSALTIGGIKPDGADGTNDLSYLCLEAMSLCKLPEPNLCVRFCELTPHEFILDSARLIRKGFGMPSVFCDEVCIAAMMTLDIELETARDYASMGCVEIAIPGKWGHRATGMTYINFGKVFEIVLNNGRDPATDIALPDLECNDLLKFEYKSYDDLWQAWKVAISYYFDLAVDCDLVCDRSLKYHDADAFASSLVDSALERGKTLKNGGAKYDYVSQSNIGMSVVGDCLAAVKKLVFDDKLLSMTELRAALETNFEGRDGARIRKLCRDAPKFGNDDDYVDKLVADVFESYLELLPKHKTDRYGHGPVGCGYTMSTSNITSYVPNGFAVGATPDGRLSGKPLNEGASPCLGADRNGPTAVINSVSKLPNHKMAGGQLLNMRFSPGALDGDDNLEKFAYFIEAGRLKNIFHNQFNVVDSETLRRAKEHPEEYVDLMVRVAGYCALFSTLMPEAQDAIIARTELAW